MISRRAYLPEEEVELMSRGFYWSNTSQAWIGDRRGHVICWAHMVLVGPRWWTMAVTPGNGIHGSPDEQVSPPFGTLDALLIWAKLEGWV